MALEIQARMIRKVLYESTDEPRIAPWLVAQKVSVKGSSEGETGSNEDSGESQKLIFLIFSIISATAILRLVLAFAARSGRSGKAG
jgi:hypothetical protein